MADLNKLNFMSKERFEGLSSTNVDELYFVEEELVKDDTLVHNTGNETINGTKTFTQTITGNITGSASSATTAKNYVTGGNIESALNNKQDNLPLLIANRFLTNDGTNLSWEELDPFPSIEGQKNKVLGTNGYTISWVDKIGLPDQEGQEGKFLTTDGSSTAWVNNVVTTDGNQTIAGTKTFSGKTLITNTNEYPLEIRHNSLLFSGTNDGKYIRFQDSNGDISGWVENRINNSSTGEAFTNIWAHTYTNSSKTTEVHASIGVYALPSGETYTYAPTPTSATDSSTKIATTAHVINVLKLMYPVGSVYIGTQSSCPMSQLFGTWTLVSSGRALWTGNGTSGTGTSANANYANAAANTTIEAGLPNITGELGPAVGNGANLYFYGYQSKSGAFENGTKVGTRDAVVSSANNLDVYAARFDASNSNSIYGNSDTVQPPAYVVNVWRRTA